MFSISLRSTDCIETLLPVIESAMESGEICQLQNIDHLGVFEQAALRLLVMAAHLKDGCTGKICHAQTGFALIGIDAHGVPHQLSR